MRVREAPRAEYCRPASRCGSACLPARLPAAGRAVAPGRDSRRREAATADVDRSTRHAAVQPGGHADHAVGRGPVRARASSRRARSFQPDPRGGRRRLTGLRGARPGRWAPRSSTWERQRPRLLLPPGGDPRAPRAPRGARRAPRRERPDRPEAPRRSGDAARAPAQARRARRGSRAATRRSRSPTSSRRVTAPAAADAADGAGRGARPLGRRRRPRPASQAPRREGARRLPGQAASTSS